MNKIYYELKDIDVDDLVNAGAVLLRVFVELSVDCFIDKKGRPKQDKRGNSLKLNQKVQSVIDFMVGNGIATKSEVKGIQVAVSNKHSILSIDTFHSYVHNHHFSPVATDIKTTWDNIQVFMEKLWSNI